MAKIIKYKFLSCEVPLLDENGDPVMIDEVREGTEQIILDKGIICATQADFDANYPIAKNEAIPGTIEVSGEFDPEPDTASTDDVLNALLGVTV